MEQARDETSTTTTSTRRRRVTRSRRILAFKYFLFPCSYCLITSHYRCVNIFFFQFALETPLAVVDAFSLSSKAPTRDSTRKNKKCRSGPICRTSGAHSGNGLSSSLNNNNNNEWSANPENTLFGSRKHSVETWNSWSSSGSNLEENSSFAVRMALYDDGKTATEEETKPTDGNTEEVFEYSEEQILQRRKFLHGLFVASAAASTAVEPASAYQKAFPDNLEFSIGDSSSDDTKSSITFEAMGEDRLAVQKSRSKMSKKPPRSKNNLLTNPSAIADKVGPLGAAAWGGALWLLLGSRSNPLVKPLANLLYNVESEKGAWVKGRNEGLFTPIPPAFTLVMGVVFLAVGLITDVAVLFATQGDLALAFQLAGVSFIAGGTLELGRIASGEKMSTKEEMARDEMLAEEFEEFAERRLLVSKGGSVHRSEVTRSFRKYYAKYRVENDDYPLVDLEIERLLRKWNVSKGSREDISSAGFLKGVKINTDAEIR